MKNNKNKQIAKEEIENIKKNLGSTIKRIRKCANISQHQMSEILSLHQAAYSRLESGRQSISPWQIFKLSEFFSIPIDHLLSGTINYWKVAENFNQKPPFPDRYCQFPYSKVRELLPSIIFLKETKGKLALDEVFKSFNLDLAYLTNHDQNIGTNCNLDLIKFFLENKLLSKKTFNLWIKTTRTPEAQGNLHNLYKAQISSLDLIQSWALNSRLYENNFHYEIESRTKDRLTISISPNDHMQNIDYKNNVLGDILCQYKKEYIAQFPKYIGASTVKLSEKDCHFHGSKKCIYEIKTS